MNDQDQNTIASPAETAEETWREAPWTVLKGFCMGMADVIPGISGGTIAFLLGIYERLIFAIRSVDTRFVSLMFKMKWREAFSGVAWRFLLSLGAGILIAVLSLSRLLSWLIEHQTVYIYSFFFGLILATVPIIGRIIKKWTSVKLLLTILAAAITFLIVSLTPVQTSEALWFVFLSGALAISAMILPGISGAFILVLLGKYEYVLDAINTRDFFALSAFMSGIGVGIVTFARVLGWLFRKFHDGTIAFLTGIVIGSLAKIWPWKETVTFIEGRHGELVPVEQINVLPPWSPEVFFALMLMALGFYTALLLNRAPSRAIQLHHKS